MSRNGWLAFILPIIVGGSARSFAGVTPQQATARATAIVHRMTVAEKVRELHGRWGSDHYRYVPGVKRLGIPPLIMTNGPAGVGPGNRNPQPRATGLPAPIALSSTWDPEAARQYGVVEGRETRDVGAGMLEAPDVNIARNPQGGRTFESYGEDPFLTSQIAVADIEGVQSTGVIANVKHYVANNQENHRFSINEIVGQRALREIYMPAFKAAVEKGDVASVMCAYPRVNGEYNCANRFLLTHVLKKEWNFQGFVVSDFGATHSTVRSALAGLDLEMPTGKYFSSRMEAAIQDGKVPISVINDKLIRRFSKMIEFGLFNAPRPIKPIPVLEDAAVARSIADEGAVLLKNQGEVLPLHADQLHSVALIGPYAVQGHDGGGGSSHVLPLFTVLPKNGIHARLSMNTQFRVLSGSDIAAAAAAARKADVAIVVVGDEDSEGHDQSLTLPHGQNQLVAAVAEANPKTIVVLQTGSAVLMPWLSKVAAVLETWYPGEEDGNVLGDLLFGRKDPSGKLSLTFPVQASDTFARNEMEYPGNGKTVDYTEGIEVGYRWYQTHHLKPLFPFGFGLSYTAFQFSHLSVAEVNPARHTVVLRFEVKNTGKVAGAEVAQVYVGFPEIAEGNEAPRQLKGFDRIYLNPGQTGTITVKLDAQSFSYWSTTDHSWKVQPGQYRVMVGDSSTHLPLSEIIDFHS
jgi:beta-glucosidase